MCIESCFSNLNTGIVNYSNKPEVKYLDIDTKYLSYTGTETDVVIAHQARNTSDYTSDLVAKLKGFIPMGVEIEVEHTPDNDYGWDRDESTEEALLEMHSYTHYIDDTDSRLRQLVIAKVDGSLDHGVEFVTQPMTLRAHNKIDYDALQGKGFYAWNAGTAGLHVHVPKSWFTTTQLWIYLKLYQNLFFEETYFNWIAGRGECQWALRKMPKRIDATNNLLAVAATKSDDTSGRYSALNFANPYTLEHRFFRSNMNPVGLISRLEFIQASYDFVVVLSSMPKQELFEVIGEGLAKHLHAFIIANETEFDNLAGRLISTRRFGSDSGFLNDTSINNYILNGLEQARKGA